VIAFIWQTLKNIHRNQDPSIVCKIGTFSYNQLHFFADLPIKNNMLIKPFDTSLTGELIEEIDQAALAQKKIAVKRSPCEFFANERTITQDGKKI
jgi:hypothetical protein